MGELKDKLKKVRGFLRAVFALNRGVSRQTTEKKSLDDDFLALRASNNICKYLEINSPRRSIVQLWTFFVFSNFFF